MAARAACPSSMLGATAELGLAVFRDQNGQPAGIIVDMYRELGRRSACPVDVQLIPPARMMAMRDHNQIPMVAPSSAAVVNLYKGSIFVPMFVSHMDLIVHKQFAKGISAHSISDPNIRFGVMRGARYGDWADKFISSIPDAQRVVVNSVENIYRMMEAGRIQATFGNDYVYRYYLKQMAHADDFLIVHLKELPTVDVGPALLNPPLSEADLQLLITHLKGMRDDGTMEKILSQHFDPQTSRSLSLPTLHQSEVRATK
ncbi:transporter substrate-binding domain-containing protein [Burkholderiaceae bacterium DAT-1]|nr:transporter substrate-binding domain-containing protein [Burkholderiaceae bacterium DAT-1]